VNIYPSDDESIKRAALFIRSGDLVIVPTETVYGLAANALMQEAVEKIFIAKGRPAGHPLICHVGVREQLSSVVATWPKQAEALANAFWPGPLTIVLEKSAGLPSVVTGGLETAAVRMPGHALLRRLILESGVPLAAPSANPFMSVSPTRVEHLAESVVQAARMVIDGGPCSFGIESTIVDLTESSPRLLRPGAVSAAEVEQVLQCDLMEGDRSKAPGGHPKHYAPSATLRFVDAAEGRPGLVFGSPTSPGQIEMPRTAKEYASRLYDALHTLDRLGYREIWVEVPPSTKEWDAVRDRLERARSDG